jgi:hypothetical protein
VDTFGTLIGYEYDHAGRYRERVYIRNAEELEVFMRGVVATAFVDGREIMITDAGDNAVFHVKDGAVLHAGGANVRDIEALLAKWGTSIHARSHSEHSPSGLPSWREGWKERHGIENPRSPHRREHATSGHEEEQVRGQGYGR